MKEARRILVLTLSFGSGHVRAAEAIFDELKRQVPDAEIKMIDALENCSLPFRAFYVWTYWAMIRFAPRVWGKFFASRVERRDEQTAPVWVWRAGCKRVFAEIEDFKPDFVFACEVGACEIAVIARCDGMINAKIVNVITDFEAEPIWVKPEISNFFVANESVANQLKNWGAATEKISVCGIPLDTSFSFRFDENETCRMFGLDKRPIVLLMGGGMGPTRMDKVAEKLLLDGENLQIVALPGKDGRAKEMLEKLKNTETVNLKILDWTSEVAALMQAAKVLATKPGGLTLSEAAICGVPLVLFDAIPGPEKSNAQRFVRRGAGILTNNAEATTRAILEILANPQKQSEMAQNVKKLAQPESARKIVETVFGREAKSDNQNQKNLAVAI
jgi:processive 1,2-diacylglycerol beta-glucosyltransferase